MAALAVATGRTLPAAKELPMQWGWDGKPTWSAPRHVALAFIPVIATVVLVAVSLTRQVSAVLLAALSLLTADAVYLWLLKRALTHTPP